MGKGRPCRPPLRRGPKPTGGSPCCPGWADRVTACSCGREHHPGAARLHMGHRVAALLAAGGEDGVHMPPLHLHPFGSDIDNVVAVAIEIHVFHMVEVLLELLLIGQRLGAWGPLHLV
ncbi:MAG: hypothetical protein ACK559_29820, partial [bacterium]